MAKYMFIPLIFILTGVLFLVPIPVTGQSGGGSVPPGGGGNGGQGLRGDFFNREPVLVFETTGFSFTGAIHRRLAVYSDGTASVSKVSGIPGSYVSDADFTTVSVNLVVQLQRDLMNAGAAQLRDQKYVVKDVPMSTVTFYSKPGPIAESNTFNYHLPHEQWFRVDAVIDNFMNMWFPGF